MATTTPASPPAEPNDPLDLTTSVAGEEDPGASIDLTETPDTPAFPMHRPEEGADKAGKGRADGV